MGGINVNRWLGGGIVAAIAIFVMEGVASVFYMDDMEASLAALGIAMEMTASSWILAVSVSLLGGLALVFFYAAARPRFGPGPRTAIIMATAYWFGGMLIHVLGYEMIGIYPTGMLAQWGIIGLVELNVAALLGGWIYREEGGS